MVKPQEDGRVLLDVLVERSGGSRRAAKRLLDERRVFVNGRRIWMARHRLNDGDRVEIQGDPAPAPSARPEPEALPVLYEDDEYLVVNKPAGRLSNADEHSIEAELRNRRQEPDIQAVHRLDRDTTGCLWFARSRKAFESAVACFREDRVQKTYEAIVIGAWPRGQTVLRKPLDGKTALTQVEVVRSNARASLLRLTLMTGRMHQVRRHVLDAGFPLAGDKHYGATFALPPEFRRLPRQMLHALALSCPHPLHPEKHLAARAPRPHDFQDTLHALDLAPEAVRAGGSYRGGGRRPR